MLCAPPPPAVRGEKNLRLPTTNEEEHLVTTVCGTDRLSEHALGRTQTGVLGPFFFFTKLCQKHKKNTEVTVPSDTFIHLLYYGTAEFGNVRGWNPECVVDSFMSVRFFFLFCFFNHIIYFLTNNQNFLLCFHWP